MVEKKCENKKRSAEEVTTEAEAEVPKEDEGKGSKKLVEKEIEKTSEDKETKEVEKAPEETEVKAKEPEKE